MDLRNEHTRTIPRLIAGCALGALLAAASGCVGDSADLDPGEQPDSLRGDRPITADAGVISHDPGNVACPGTPVADAGTYDPGQPKPGYPPHATPCPCQDAGIYDPGPTPVDAGAGPVQRCSSHLLGDGKSCVSDVDLKLKAEAVCAAEGLALTDIKIDGAPCPGGSTQPWFSCCKKEPTPVATACLSDVIGDGTTCLDWDSIKLKATGACEGNGMGLVELIGTSNDDDCAGGATWAKYECCHQFPFPQAGAEPPKPVSAVVTAIPLK
jgi:hypothetical protein